MNFALVIRSEARRHQRRAQSKDLRYVESLNDTQTLQPPNFAFSVFEVTP